MLLGAIANQNNEYIEVLELSDLKLRPIVANPTCPTRPLNDLLDKIFKPFILQVKITLEITQVFWGVAPEYSVKTQS